MMRAGDKKANCNIDLPSQNVPSSFFDSASDTSEKSPEQRHKQQTACSSTAPVNPNFQMNVAQPEQSTAMTQSELVKKEDKKKPAKELAPRSRKRRCSDSESMTQNIDILRVDLNKLIAITANMAERITMIDSKLAAIFADIARESTRNACLERENSSLKKMVEVLKKENASPKATYKAPQESMPQSNKTNVARGQFPAFFDTQIEKNPLSTDRPSMIFEAPPYELPTYK